MVQDHLVIPWGEVGTCLWRITSQPSLAPGQSMFNPLDLASPPYTARKPEPYNRRRVPPGLKVIDSSSGEILQQSPTDTFPLDSGSLPRRRPDRPGRNPRQPRPQRHHRRTPTIPPPSSRLPRRSSPASVEDINLGYFYTAIQAVYGSAVPLRHDRSHGHAGRALV